MSDFFRSLFQMKLSTSVLSGEEENRIKINYLLPLVLFTLLIVVISALVALISKAYIIMVAFLICAVILFTALDLLRNGTLKLPAILFVVQGYVFLSFLVLFQGSQPILSTIGIVFYLIITGFLFKPKILNIAIAYSVLLIFLLLKEIVPPIIPAADLPEWYTAWVCPIFVIGLIGLLAYVSHRAVNQSLQIATTANAERYRIQNEEKKLKSIVEQSLGSVLITDVDGNIEYANSRFSEWMGYEAEEVLGKNPRMFKTEFSPAEFHESLWKMITNGETWEGEFVNRRKDESLIYLTTKIEPQTDEITGDIHYVAYQEDISQQKAIEQELDQTNKQLQDQLAGVVQLKEQLHDQSLQDGLTGLYNRAYLYEILPREFLRSIRAKNQLILMLIDVDRFRSVNEKFGYASGDDILRSISKRIVELNGTYDIACRYGDDKFILLLSGVNDELGETRARQIRDSFANNPINFDNHDISVTVSIGISVYPVHGKTVDEILTTAESALEISKKSGGNQVTLWSDTA